jgi:transcriptional regulator with XRE-family HTH domain
VASPKRQSGFAREVQHRDRLIAARVRERRIALGLSQAQLAEAVCVTKQQLHNYEAGTSRIAASRLFDFAQALGAPVAFFFDGLGPESDGAGAARSRRLLDLVRVFEGLSTEQQALLLRMSAALAGERADTLNGSAG